MGSTHTVFVGSQDGRVYALDADLGARRGGTLWYTSPALGPAVQGGVAGMFTFFGGAGNHLLVGTRPSPGAAQFFALDPATGSPRPGSPFIGSIGPINTTASVDYVRAQVYFASHEFSAVQPSLWCLKLTASGLGATCWTPQTLPLSISGGPVERNGTVYVGDDFGQVWAFSASAGTSNWAVPYIGCGGGAAVKSFVLADRLGTAQDLYYATNAQLCAVTDLGGTPSTKWSLSSIPSPSAPVLVRIGGVAYLYVGSSDGRLYEIDPDTAAIKSVVVRAGAAIGAPAFDVRDNMIYVGSTAGAIYAVQVPLP
jgi:outer membrane protein assembly factor BamB